MIGFPVGKGVDVCKRVDVGESVDVSFDVVETNSILPSVSGKTSLLDVRYPLSTSTSIETATGA